jgi:hypothetical protein
LAGQQIPEAICPYLPARQLYIWLSTSHQSRTRNGALETICEDLYVREIKQSSSFLVSVNAIFYRSSCSNNLKKAFNEQRNLEKKSLYNVKHV